MKIRGMVGSVAIIIRLLLRLSRFFFPSYRNTHFFHNKIYLLLTNKLRKHGIWNFESVVKK